ncbi:MAG TPA: DUF4149 domain-containing protein [Candidatus Acidoferrales bacterium]|nr:DUF4149 domain-containing protein [Candidatus Acidoferrales bacterium]
MTTIVRFVQIFSLGTWVGAGLFVTLVVAQGAFRQLPTPDLAGAVVGYTLTRLNVMGIVAGVVFLFTAAALGGAANVTRPAALLVVLMMALTAASQFGVTPRMEGLRKEMAAAHGSIAATPREDPVRQSFGRLHGVSASLELATLVIGLAALFLTVREMGQR